MWAIVELYSANRAVVSLKRGNMAPYRTPNTQEITRRGLYVKLSSESFSYTAGVAAVVVVVVVMLVLLLLLRSAQSRHLSTEDN